MAESSQMQHTGLTAMDLKQAVQQDDGTFLGQVLRYGASTLTGTHLWWDLRKQELFSLVESFGHRYLFMTLT
jgi:hypothetical protein